MATFAEEREWGVFHTPRNLVLALVGETGELAEAFQWRGDAGAGPGLAGWSAADARHVGEELSDVLLYLVRLSDRCGVDLGAGVVGALRSDGNFGDSVAGAVGAAFTQVTLAAASAGAAPRGPRDLVFGLVRRVGVLAAAFDDAPDGDGGAAPGLPLWSRESKASLRAALADVLLAVARLAASCGIDVGAAAARKMRLNRAKYPVAAARGRSDKYTAYASSAASGAVNGADATATVGVAGGDAVAYVRGGALRLAAAAPVTTPGGDSESPPSL